MDASMNAQPQPSIMETAFQTAERSLSDLIDEISSLEQMIGPVLTPEDQEKTTSSPSGERQPMSAVARETFNFAERVTWQTQRLNAIKRRVEL